MSAARHIHPDQLAMFLPAHHLADPTKVQHSDQSAYADVHVMRKIKLQESKVGATESSWARARGGGETHLASVHREGVKTPVMMHPEGPTVMDGHHRIFAAEQANKNMEVPVEWVDW